MHTHEIRACVDGGEPESLRLVDRRSRLDWTRLPVGVLTLAVDYRRGAVVLVEKPPRGRPAAVRTLAPLADSGEPEPGRITRGDVLSLFEEGDA